MKRDRYPVVAELKALRLARSWSYERLAGEMEKAGFPVSVRTLHYLFRERTPFASLNELTVYKTEHFLAVLRQRERQRRKTARSRRRAASDAVSA